MTRVEALRALHALKPWSIQTAVLATAGAVFVRWIDWAVARKFPGRPVVVIARWVAILIVGLIAQTAHFIPALLSLGWATWTLGWAKASRSGLGSATLGVAWIAFWWFATSRLFRWASALRREVSDASTGVDEAIAELAVESPASGDPAEALPRFCAATFSWRGSLQLHRPTLGFDLLIHPLNTLMAIPLLGLRKTLDVLELLGWGQPKAWVGPLATGFRTRTQAAIENSVRRHLVGIEPGTATPALEAEITRQLRAFSNWRASVADLIASGALLWATSHWLHISGSNPMELGREIARRFATDDASSRFILGRSLGSMFYRNFPVDPTNDQIMAATAAVLGTFAAASLVASLLCDPLLQLLGVYERKLKMTVEAIETKQLVERLAGERPDQTPAR